jgi:hypothetical protein
MPPPAARIMAFAYSNINKIISCYYDVNTTMIIEGFSRLSITDFGKAPKWVTPPRVCWQTHFLMGTEIGPDVF